MEEQLESEYRYRSKKNTKKWCKGKVGVEHEYETKDYYKDLQSGWSAILPKLIGRTFVDVCKNCGKRTNWDFRAFREGVSENVES